MFCILIVQQAIFVYVNHILFPFFNQPVLSNKGKVSCRNNEQEPFTGISRD